MPQSIHHCYHDSRNKNSNEDDNGMKISIVQTMVFANEMTKPLGMYVRSCKVGSSAGDEGKARTGQISMEVSLLELFL